MRKSLKSLVTLCAVALASLCATAIAQTYPYSNPTYIPTASTAPVTLSAPGTVNFVTSGLATASVRISGTCTGLVAAVQASNDNGSNYTTINMYPVATGTSAPTAAASAGATGFWKSNVAGFTNIRVNVTALTASCTFALAGTHGSFNGTTF